MNKSHFIQNASQTGFCDLIQRLESHRRLDIPCDGTPLALLSKPIQGGQGNDVMPAIENSYISHITTVVTVESPRTIPTPPAHRLYA